MISAISWIRKGVAKEIPDKFELTPEDYERIANQVGSQVQNAKSQLKENQDKNQTDALDEMIPELEQYNLQDYDQESSDDEDSQNPLFGNIKGLTIFSKDGKDPYVKISDEQDDQEELEEMRILPTVLLTAKTEDDLSHLEVYVFEEEEDNLYVHHDIMLPSFPLCIEWMDFNLKDPSTPG